MSAPSNLQLRGSGQLKFLGFQVYEAKLFAAPQAALQRYWQQALKLEIHYQRALKGEQIAERSLAEMRRQAEISETQAEQWLAAMKRGFPDIKAGDRLLGEFDGRKTVRFLHNQKETLRIDDEQFARFFFGIWLAEQSSAPALRKALLGLTPANPKVAEQ